jgi:hypothetical protein
MSLPSAPVYATATSSKANIQALSTVHLQSRLHMAVLHNLQADPQVATTFYTGTNMRAGSGSYAATTPDMRRDAISARLPLLGHAIHAGHVCKGRPPPPTSCTGSMRRVFLWHALTLFSFILEADTAMNPVTCWWLTACMDAVQSNTVKDRHTSMRPRPHADSTRSQANQLKSPFQHVHTQMIGVTTCSRCCILPGSTPAWAKRPPARTHDAGMTP